MAGGIVACDGRCFVDNHGACVITAADLEHADLRPLPAEVLALCERHDAAPRLVAHLTLVHDVAWRLVRAVRKRWPALPIDVAAVTFGAATHDIGKAVHREELSVPGTLHEPAGFQLLVDAGISTTLARFTRTHGAWQDAADLGLEDLLVVLADTAWKGKRSQALDDRLAAVIAAATGRPAWEVFVALDDVIAGITADADARLAWHAQYPA